MVCRRLIFVLHVIWGWGIFTKSGSITCFQLPPLGVAASTPHLYGEVKTLQIRDHGWVGPSHVHQETSIAQQLLVGVCWAWIHQSHPTLLQDPPHLGPFLLGGQNAHSELIHDVDYGAGSCPCGLTAWAGLSHRILDPKITLLRSQYMTGLPGELLGRTHHLLVIHECEKITCNLFVLPPHY